MRSIKRLNPLLVGAVLLATMLCAGRAVADSAAVPAYKTLETPFSVKVGKTVVTEFFSYGCPHCAAFEPHMAKWAKDHAASVTVERVPVGFRPQWIPLQKLYFAMAELGVADAMSNRVFDALHQQHKPLYTDEAVLQWASAQGLDSRKLTAAYQSFSVAHKVAQADQLVATSHIEGVPGLVVNGKYLVNNEAAKNPEGLTIILDEVLSKASAKK
jgi:thiol:disulfide interchange protein DsbA